MDGGVFMVVVWLGILCISVWMICEWVLGWDAGT